MTFVGWQGDADCADGLVKVDAPLVECIAVFEPTTRTLEVAKDGLGTGVVTTDPSGLDCGAVCEALFALGASVVLTATPDDGSSFAGWSGDADCSDGNVTLDVDRSCVATFDLDPQTLTVDFRGTGAGRVVSEPGGLACSTACQASFPAGDTVILTATALAGSVFRGWSGDCAGTAPVMVEMTGPRTCGARFDVDLTGPGCRTVDAFVPDLGSVSDDLVVVATGSPENLELALEIDHTFVGDLVVTLEHLETATTVRMIDRPGPACSENDVVVRLDDGAFLPVNEQCASESPALDGHLLPVEPLSGFDGGDFSGTWRLVVADEAEQDVGTLVGWCLHRFTPPFFRDGFESGDTSAW